MSVHLVEHPLIRHKLGLMRVHDVSTKQFRELANELATLLTYEATKDLETETITIKGWAGDVAVENIKGKKIYRGADSARRSGHDGRGAQSDSIGKSQRRGALSQRGNSGTRALLRENDQQMEERIALILDPMLATGGTLAATIDLIKESGCRQIRGLFLVAAPEGLRRLEEAHPDVDIYVASIDEKLNDIGYILPGLGDAGDKIFGTK